MWGYYKSGMTIKNCDAADKYYIVSNDNNSLKNMHISNLSTFSLLPYIRNCKILLML